jgi:hypothetical protein
MEPWLRIFLKTIELLLSLNHSSQKNQGIGQKNLLKLLILCWFFHENQEFFVNFRKPKTKGSTILILIETQNQN